MFPEKEFDHKKQIADFLFSFSLILNSLYNNFNFIYRNKLAIK